MESPYQKLFAASPNYLKLRVYGCLCFPWLRPYTNHKLEDCSTPCVFIGYSQTQSAYLCLQPITGRIYVSRHVRFDERVFPFLQPPITKTTIPTETTTSHQLPPTTTIPISPPIIPIPQSPLVSPGLSSSAPHLPPENSTDVAGALSDDTANQGTSLGPNSNQSSPLTAQQATTSANSPLQRQAQSPSSTDASHVSSSSPESTPAPPPLAELPTPPPSPKPVAPPPAIAINAPPENLHPMVTRQKNHISKPNQKYNYSARLSQSIPAEPNTVNQALKDEKWCGAMSEEIDAFATNQTFDLVPRQPQYNVVGCKWIFKNKFYPNGSHRKCKARLVTKGYNQQFGQDYTDTFSPVIKATTIRMVLDIVVTKAWPIQQLDVNNAFLQGTLNEEVYMEQPPGFVDTDNPSHVCRLRKAIYGLKQAPRAWYTELRNFLLSLVLSTHLQTRHYLFFGPAKNSSISSSMLTIF